MAGSSLDFSKNGLNMNFQSYGDDSNWNRELIDYADNIDKTTETVDGGLIKLIQVYPFGKTCIQYIFLSCGSSTWAMNTERAVMLDVSTIQKAWFLKGDDRVLDIDFENNCIWFAEDSISVRAIDILPGAFACDYNAADCIAQKNIRILILMVRERQFLFILYIQFLKTVPILIYA